MTSRITCFGTIGTSASVVRKSTSLTSRGKAAQRGSSQVCGSTDDIGILVTGVLFEKMTRTILMHAEECSTPSELRVETSFSLTTVRWVCSFQGKGKEKEEYRRRVYGNITEVFHRK